jgi:hypothetical protein
VAADRNIISTPSQRRPKVEPTPEPTAPFKSSIAPSTLDTSFKEQKASLLEQIDEALKSTVTLDELKAGKPIGKVNLKVPGAGEYNITNTKDALIEFRRRVVGKYPTNEGTKRPPALRATSTKRLTGEGVEYYNPYKVREQDIISTEGRRGRGKENYTHEGWFSNGQYAIKSEPPAGITTEAKPAIEKIITPPEKLVPARVQGEFFYQRPAEEPKPSPVSYQPGYKPAETPAEPKPPADDEWMKTPVAHVVGGKLDAMLDPQYVDSILTKYPNAKPFLASQDAPLVYFKDGDQMVGVVAKIKGSVPSRFNERMEEVKLGVEPVQLPSRKKPK